jgi:hypothetical protein
MTYCSESIQNIFQRMKQLNNLGKNQFFYQWSLIMVLMQFNHCFDEIEIWC